MLVHVFRIKKHLEYLESLGINTNPALQVAGLQQDDLRDENGMLGLEPYQAIFDFAIRATHDPFYGIHFGKIPFVAGTVGLMGASSRNLKEAFQAGCAVFQSLGNVDDVQFEDGKDASLLRYTVSDSWKMQFPETARHSIDIMFSYLMQIVNRNSNEDIHPVAVRLNYPDPGHPEIYYDLFSIHPTFDAETNEMVFRNRDLQIPMRAFNPAAQQILREHLEKQMKAIHDNLPVHEKVRQVLLRNVRYEFPDIETVAQKLRMSPRTLQRSLSKEKTSFKMILQETRYKLACEMLRQRGLSISEVGYALGYSDLANFSRSFKKLSGISPAAYRKV